MGQEHSQDPQETESDQEEPRQPDSTNKSLQSESRTSPRSPDAEPKPRRLLWRDGGWVGNAMGSPPCGLEIVSKTVWYQGENSDQGSRAASQIQRVNSQTVWYDSDIMYEGKHEQLKQADCDLSSAQTPGLSPPQLLELGLSSQCTALSQPHAAGALPTLSHGPAAQRQEVHGSQREEEVGLGWKEGGVTGGREEVGLTETSYSRENCEAADIEETGEEKPVGEERGAKGRKKRRKKKGRRGGAEAKLSSSSSVDSQSQSETLSHREPATSLGPRTATDPEAQDTKRAQLQSPTAPEPACREEADEDAMHIPSQTDTHTRDTHGPVCDVTAPESGYTGTTGHGRTDLTEASEMKESSEDMNQVFCEDLSLDSAVAASDLSQRIATETDTMARPQGGKETLESSELGSQGAASPVQQTADDTETKELAAAGEDGESVDLTGLLESKCPEELPVRQWDRTALTEDHSLVEFPEQNTQHAQSVRSAEAVALPCEGTADCSASQIREGNAEATVREYLVHCLDSEMLRDQRLGTERRRVVWVGDEGDGEETSVERRRRDGEDSEELSHRETEQSYDDDLLATAVAVVTVAIASAVVSVELSQQSDSQQSAHDAPSAQGTTHTHALKQHLHSHSQSTQLTSDRQTCHPSAETEDQDVHHSHPGPPEGSEESDGETELSEAAHTPSVVQPESTQTKATPDEAITSEEDRQTHPQTETQLSSPGVDTGQDPESSHTPCPESESTDKQGRETQDRDVGLADEAPAAEDEVGGQVQQQECPGDADRECQTGQLESSHMSDCQAEGSHSVNAPCEGKGPSVTLPVGPCASAPEVDLVPHEPTALVSVEAGASQSSQSLVDNREGPEDVVCDEDQDAVDIVDGWKHRERERMEREEEARKQVVTAEETSHTGKYLSVCLCVSC